MPANNADFMVARLLPDGTLDASFNATGIATVDFPGVADSLTLATGVAVDADGRIVIAGTVGANSGFGNIGLARLTPDGHLDTDFGTGGTTVPSLGPSLRSAASKLLIAHDGKLVVSGGIGGSAGEYTDMAVLRFMPDGTLDPSFGEGGIARVDYNLAAVSSEDQDYAMSVIEMPDAKLVLVGEAGYGDMGFYEAAARAPRIRWTARRYVRHRRHGRVRFPAGRSRATSGSPMPRCRAIASSRSAPPSRKVRWPEPSESSRDCSRIGCSPTASIEVRNVA